MIVITATAFVLAAAAGALARAEVGRILNRPDAFPFGTLLVNVTGSFAMGLLTSLNGTVGTIFGVGFLGAYTTVSSFARDAVELVIAKRWVTACLYVGCSALTSVGAAWAGLALVR